MGAPGGIGTQVGRTATAEARRQQLRTSVCLKRGEPGVEL